MPSEQCSERLGTAQLRRCCCCGCPVRAKQMRATTTRHGAAGGSHGANQRPDDCSGGCSSPTAQGSRPGSRGCPKACLPACALVSAALPAQRAPFPPPANSEQQRRTASLPRPLALRDSHPPKLARLSAPSISGNLAPAPVQRHHCARILPNKARRGHPNIFALAPAHRPPKRAAPVSRRGWMNKLSTARHPSRKQEGTPQCSGRSQHPRRTPASLLPCDHDRAARTQSTSPICTPPSLRLAGTVAPSNSLAPRTVERLSSTGAFAPTPALSRKTGVALRR